MVKWSLLLVVISAQSFAKLNIVTEHFPPFQYVDKHAKLNGFIAEKVHRALERSAIDYSISVHNWTTAYNTVLRDPQTCIFSISRSVAREHKFIWIAKLTELSTYFYGLHSKKIKLDNLEHAKQYRVAVLRDNYSHHYLIRNGFEVGKNLMLMESFDNIFAVVKNRHSSIDLVLLPKQRVLYEYKKTGVTDYLIPILALNKEQPALYFACNTRLNVSIKQQLEAAFSSH